MTRRRKRRRSPQRRLLVRSAVVLALAMAIVLLRLVETIDRDQPAATRFRVVRVIDGDTVELTGGDRLRLLAVDAPEQGEPMHDEAVAFLRRHLLGRQVRLEFAHTRRDRYGRLLAYVYRDTVFVNRMLIDSGMAWLYLFRDNELDRPEVAALLQAQRSALSRKVGVWAVAYQPEPYYVGLPGSFRLHRPGCRSLAAVPPDRYIRYATREEGLAAGLSPCRNCRP